MRTFAISDIHGGYLALKELLSKVNFDYENDKLICIGDTCDAWPQVKECFDLLLKIKNLIYIWGNHDLWAWEYYNTKNIHDSDNPWEEDYRMGESAMSQEEFYNWYKQGGHATVKSFGKKIPNEIIELFNNAKNYYIDDKNRIFVHGGFDTSIDIEKHSRLHLVWDRELIYEANHKMAMHEKHGHPAKISKYDKIFIGHTPTLCYHQTTPIINCELHMIDTGGSYSGPLTIVDVDTDEYWQSKPVCDYYPGIKSRGHSYL